jgi:hypothetical protein
MPVIVAVALNSKYFHWNVATSKYLTFTKMWMVFADKKNVHEFTGIYHTD